MAVPGCMTVLRYEWVVCTDPPIDMDALCQYSDPSRRCIVPIPPIDMNGCARL